MVTTRHAERRMRQRGFTKNKADLILKYGKPVREYKGAIEYRILEKDIKAVVNEYSEDPRERRHLSEDLNRCRNKVLIIDDKGIAIITAYNKNRKRIYRA